MPRVVILLLNWNGWRDTITCLESVLRLDYPNYRVIVCDNASSDDSISQIRAWMKGALLADPPSEILAGLVCPPVGKPLSWVETLGSVFLPESASSLITLIQTGDNLGFAGGNNVGLRHALACEDTDFVWLLNNDTVVSEDALTHLVERAQRSPAPGITGSALCYMHSPETLQAFGGASFAPWRGRGLPLASGEKYGPRTPETMAALEAQLAYVVGASMLVSRAFLEEVGLMNEDYFLYFEEIDWATRAKGRYQMAIAPLSRVYHKVGGTAGTDISIFSMRYMVRNQLVFTRRFYPRQLLTVRLQMLFDGLKALVNKRLALSFLLIKTAVSPVHCSGD